jgi:ribosome-associated translation inhibitor RaiA
VDGQAVGRAAGDLDLEVVFRGTVVDEMTLAYVRRKVLAAARVCQAPVRFGRMKITHEPDPSIARSTIVAVTLDVDGHAVRAHAAGRTVLEAVDIAEERLRRQLVDVRHRLAFLRRRRMETVTPGEWRHGGIPTDRPERFPRVPEEREIVRRKSISLGRTTPEDAAVEMEMLDHDFHLFIDSGTGRDAVVRRMPDGTYEMSLARGDDEQPEGVVEIGVGPPPQAMTLGAAVERLNVTNEPFVFFVDDQTQRGAVLYRRYDGHYGVVTAESELGIEKEGRR